MPSIDFVCLPDIHVGALATVFPDIPDYTNLLFETMMQAVTYAKENGISVIIVLGDIFDFPEPDQTQINSVLQFLSLLQDFSVYVIPGNHDYSHLGKNSLEVANFVSRFGGMNHVRYFMQPTAIRIHGVPFSFLPWPVFDRSLPTAKKGPRINIAHIEAAGAISDNGHPIKDGHQLNIDEDYWIIGHLHRKQKYKRIFYPGTMYQKSFGETLPKGFLHVSADFEDGELTVNPQWMAVQPSFELHNLTIEKPEDLRKITKYNNTERPLQRYKLFIRNDIALPTSFRADNPHVVKVEGWRNKQELTAVREGSVSILHVPSLDMKQLVFRDLTPFLKGKGLDKPERVRARSIIDEIIANIEED